MRLLADLGNTRLKCALVEGDRMRARWAGTHAQAEDGLRDWLLREARSIEDIWLAAVAQEDVTRVVTTVLRALGPEPVRVRTRRHALGLTAGYTHVEELGVDRWLALIAAFRRGLAPCVVASVGSALIGVPRCAPAEWPLSTKRVASPPHCAASRCAAASALPTYRACCSGGVSGSIG